MNKPITTAEILWLAADKVVPWNTCWRALGPPSPERDEAWQECEQAWYRHYEPNETP